MLAAEREIARVGASDGIALRQNGLQSMVAATKFFFGLQVREVRDFAYSAVRSA
jgi:hypothetical protein